MPPASRFTLLLFVCVFAAGLALFTRRNDFPFYYHPDEPGKVSQLIKGKRNFHHPMLLLTTADLARRAALWGETKRDPQRVVEVGRWVTACFAALTVATLAVLALQVHGIAAGLAVGAVGLVNPLLFELAHYFKEDPTLTAGIALTVLALRRFREQPDHLGLIWLGAAAGLAAAGKYPGFGLLPVVIVAALVPRGSQTPRSRRLAWVLGTFVVVWLALNWWVFKSPEILWRSVGEETAKAFGGEDGPVRSVPHGYYFQVQWLYGSVLVPIFAAAWIALVALRKMKVDPAEWVLLGVAVTLFVACSFTPKTSPRYHLPVAVALSYFAALGAVGLAAWIAGFWRSRRASVGPDSGPFSSSHAPFVTGTVLTLLFAGSLAAAEFRQTMTRLNALASDDRAALFDYVRATLPRTTVLAQDEAVNLPEPQRRPEHAGRAPLELRLLSKKQVADLGTVAQLRQNGVTHIAICARTYQRFLAGGSTPERRFYETVLQRGKVLFSKPPGLITYLQPGLVLVDINGLE